jgi:hypothetical protein
VRNARPNNVDDLTSPMAKLKAPAHMRASDLHFDLCLPDGQDGVSN